MGFMDKVKAVAKNADSIAGDLVDESKLKSSISKEKSNIDKNYAEIGKLYYQKYSGVSVSKEQLDTICEQIDASKAKIKECEKAIEETKSTGKKKREDTWSATKENEE